MMYLRASSSPQRPRFDTHAVKMGMAAITLFVLLLAAGCSHSSSDPADKDRPIAPPANAIAQIQNSPRLTPEQKQAAINAVTAARTRASGQMSVGSKKTGM